MPQPLNVTDSLTYTNVCSYLHSTFSPPVAHGNLKSANILLDENLMPRVCDCGLAILRPLTSNKVKTRVSFCNNQLHVEIVIAAKVFVTEVDIKLLALLGKR